LLGLFRAPFGLPSGTALCYEMCTSFLLYYPRSGSQALIATFFYQLIFIPPPWQPLPPVFFCDEFPWSPHRRTPTGPLTRAALLSEARHFLFCRSWFFSGVMAACMAAPFYEPSRVLRDLVWFFISTRDAGFGSASYRTLVSLGRDPVRFRTSPRGV